LLAEPLRHAVLDYLVEDEAITEEFAHRLLSRTALGEPGIEPAP
jgi:DNA-binding transcriptional ArsR family regulator